MREKLKTGVLVTLILFSFQLTSMFWMRVGAKPALVVLPTPPSSSETPESYLDLYAPLSMLVHAGANHYQLKPADSQYRQLWVELKRHLSPEQSAKSENAGYLAAQTSLSEWQQAFGNSVELRFPGQVELNYWWFAATKTNFAKMSDKDLFFDRILIPNASPYIYVRNLQNGGVWRWRWSESENVGMFSGLDKQTYSTSQSLRAVELPDGVAVVPRADLYVAQRLTTLPEIWAEPPFRTADKRGIIRQFFSITPRVPKTEILASGTVVESLITAKQQVLKLSSAGSIDYTEEEPSSGLPGNTITEQFELAFGFITAHGGWPREVLSDGITSDGKGSHRFNFVQLYDGYPLVGLTPGTLSVQVSPDGVTRYERKLFQIRRDGYFRYKLRPAEVALQAIGPLLGERKVTDIYLGYYQLDFMTTNTAAPFDVEPMYLFPVWVIELNNGEHLLVHAFDLANDSGINLPK